LKPTSRLINNHKQMFRDKSVTISYQGRSNDQTVYDELTGDPLISYDDTYNTAIELQAIIKKKASPLPENNEKGENEHIDAIIRLLIDDVLDAGIIFQLGDRFILPNDNQNYYLKKITEQKHVYDQYLEYYIAVSTKEGR